MDPIDPLQELAKAGDMISASLARAAANSDAPLPAEVAERLEELAADLKGMKSGGFRDLLERAAKKPKKRTFDGVVATPVNDQDFIVQFWKDHHLPSEPLAELIQSLLHDFERKSPPRVDTNREIWQDWDE